MGEGANRASSRMREFFPWIRDFPVGVARRVAPRPTRQEVSFSTLFFRVSGGNVTARCVYTCHAKGIPRAVPFYYSIILYYQRYPRPYISRCVPRIYIVWGTITQSVYKILDSASFGRVCATCLDCECVHARQLQSWIRTLISLWAVDGALVTSKWQ